MLAALTRGERFRYWMSEPMRCRSACGARALVGLCGWRRLLAGRLLRRATAARLQCDSDSSSSASAVRVGVVAGRLLRQKTTAPDPYPASSPPARRPTGRPGRPLPERREPVGGQRVLCGPGASAPCPCGPALGCRRALPLLHGESRDTTAGWACHGGSRDWRHSQSTVTDNMRARSRKRSLAE